ncbi:MAG: hypothetical protein GY708_04210 [Actinomycetia bacterium]|nr:hypothetical protein [Actinomycetes bacterium]
MRNVRGVGSGQGLVVATVRLTSIAAALLLITALTASRSRAAFSDTSVNTGSSFSTGSVVITDDDTGTALFSATGMTPGSAVVECIVLTYSGSVTPADIKMYGTTTGTLDTYLDTTIEIGTGGTFGNCTGFAPASTVYSGTLANFSATYLNWASGLALFTAAANPTSQTLRVTVDVQNNPAAQSQTSTADFTFEAQD